MSCGSIDRATGLGAKEERPYWDAWYEGMKLVEYWDSYCEEMRWKMIPEHLKKDLKDDWLCQLLLKNREKLALMGEAYRVLNLKVIYETEEL